MKELLLDYIDNNSGSNSYEELLKIFKNNLTELLKNNTIHFKDDFRLGGELLEIRVKLLFEDIGYDIFNGREKLEDFVIKPKDNSIPQKPLVIEVKSGKSPSIGRSDLRQLDDWVFDLSGEEKARKEGLKSAPSLIFGVSGSNTHHPTPHKGLIIYNGSINTAFNNRDKHRIGGNEIEFAEKRDFCIMTFESLINAVTKVNTQQVSSEDFWKDIHNTRGELQYS